MITWLLKTEPDDYSYDDLVRDGRTAWTGVANPAAQQAMRAMRAGDAALIYHTGTQKRISGLATVVRGAYPDPDHPGLTAKGDPKRVLVDVSAVRPSTKVLTLSDIKADDRFAGFALVTQSRLGVMEVPPGLASVLARLAGL